MARQTGILKVEGTLDNLTFYKAKDGYLVRTKGGVSKDRILNDPNFERTRENGSEFGTSAKSGKMLRDAVRTLLLRSNDNSVSNRLTQLMAKVKNTDLNSIRGERNVAEGLLTTEGKSLLKGFDFNSRAQLSSVFHQVLAIDVPTGKISIPDLNPKTDISIPGGATHVSFTGSVLNLDFATGEKSISFSPILNLVIDSTTSSQELIPDSMPSGSGNTIFLLLIEFFQEINGVQYPLKNGSYNVLNIVDVQ